MRKAVNGVRSMQCWVCSAGYVYSACCQIWGVSQIVGGCKFTATEHSRCGLLYMQKLCCICMACWSVCQLYHAAEHRRYELSCMRKAMVLSAMLKCVKNELRLMYIHVESLWYAQLAKWHKMQAWCKSKCIATPFSSCLVRVPSLLAIQKTYFYNLFFFLFFEKRRREVERGETDTWSVKLMHKLKVHFT